MPMSLKLGQELLELRKGKGMTQAEVAARAQISEKTYRRYEDGETRPSRANIVLLVRDGLKDPRLERVNRLLELAEYELLNQSEIVEYRLSTESIPVPVSEARPPHPAFAPASLSFTRYGITVYLAGLLAAWAIAAATFSGADLWFTLATGALYSLLYPLSILLETVFASGERLSSVRVATGFSVVLTASTAAVAISSWSARTGKGFGLIAGFVLLALGAAISYLITRIELPAVALVPARMSTLTAQAAHLKNTAYFVAVAVVFWLPTTHCRAMGLADESLKKWCMGIGQAASWLWMCPRPSHLWLAWGLLLALAIKMGSHLTDRLDPVPHVGRYQFLLYFRGILMLALAALWILRYSFVCAAS